MKPLVYDPTDPEQLEHINDVYRRLREEAPVHYAEKFDIYVVSRHADVEAILGDTERFSSRGANTALAYTPPEVAQVLAEGRPEAEALLTADPPRHARHRALVNRALTQRRVDQKRPRMRELAHALIDGFAAQPRADLIAAFAVPYPLNVIAEVIGIPEADRAQLKAWSSDFVARFSPDLSIEERKLRARGFVAFQRHFERAILEARADGREGFLGDFARAAFADPPVPIEEQLTTLMQTVVAGHETTTNLIGNALVLLCEWPAERARLLREPALIESAVEEFLRFESSNQLGNRRTARDVEIGGVALEAGTSLTLCIGAANRDPARFERPDALDLARSPNRHLAFGTGPHQCVGMNVARLEGRIAIGRFLARFPSFALAGAPTRSGRARFRGFSAIPAALG